MALELAVLSMLALPVYGINVTEAADTDTAKSRDIVVTANKVAEEVKAVPQAVEVITAEDIKKMGADNVYSALRLANNVNISEAGMTGNQVSIRGMSTYHTLILIDGKRISGEDTTATANYYALKRLNLDTVERIEIVRGSASVLYGSDALGGVINIITKTPTKPGGAIGFNAGTREQNIYGNYDFVSDKHLSGSISFRAAKTRSYFNNGSSSNLNGPSHYFDLKTVYDFKNANHNKLTFGLRYFNERLAADYYDSSATKYGMTFVTQKDKHEYFNTQGTGLDLSYTGKTKKNDYSFRVYYDKMDKDTLMLNDRPDFGLPILEMVLGKLYPKSQYDTMSFKTIVGEMKDTMYVNDNHTLTFGTEYKYQSYNGTRLGGGSTADTSGKPVVGHHFNTWALYAEDLWQVNDKWLVIPSARYEKNSSFGSNVVAKLGTTYNFNKDFRLKANYGRGYKAPSISELYMNMTRDMGMASVTILGNENLQPEKSLNFDIALEGEKGNFFGKASWYHNRISNLITTETVSEAGSSGVYQYVNVGNALIKGFEFQVGAHLNKNADVTLTHNIIDAMDVNSGTRLSNRAKHNTRLSFSWDDHKKNNFTAMVWADFVRNYYYSSKTYNYTTLNFSLSKKLSDNLLVTAGIDNLTNQKVDDLYIFGRVWRVGAEWKF